MKDKKSWTRNPKIRFSLKLSGLNHVNFNHPGGIYFHRLKKDKGICISQLLKSLSYLVETLSQTLAQALLICIVKIS